ncbi:MAG: succinyl-CoA:(R)-benzylsuccinate CoA-transferase subunit BbsE [Rhodospirillales bacterium]|nr:succinyl-CoA:(R)-benzylsuccinate CoA-transferase subunit BbsE [Rhodospirillales bacterium]
MARNNAGPLAGLKVIDLTHVMAGPVCTLLLADLGAEVIKIERPPEGDDSRHMAPPYIGEESAAYLIVNRHKRGIVLNLKHESGREALLRLLETADVLVENYRGGTLEKLGLGYEQLSERFPSLIWCSISGYGRTGPYADRPGFDLMAQAMSGIMSFTGEGPGRPPVKTGAPVADITAGILGALGVVAAVAHRQRTGEGQRVETSLFEAAITHTFWQSAICFATGTSPGPLGSAHPLDAPYQAFQTSDGWAVIGAANQANWLRFVRAIDRFDLADDPRFRNNVERMRHFDALIAAVSPELLKRSTQEWVALLDAAGVPVSPVLNVGEMHKDPQAIARGMIAEVEHSVLGRVKTLGNPLKFSKSSVELGRGAPVLGEHTREVLLDHGYDAAQIAALVAAGAIQCAEADDAQAVSR